jgi:murein DD-endopeptidase MepM/ murein hydrolase activator NlpD
MATLSFQLALVGAALFGPGATATSPDAVCAVSRAPGRVQSHIVNEGDRLSSIMVAAGVSRREIARVTKAMRPKSNLHKLAIGDRLDIVSRTDGTVAWFRYRQDRTHAVCARRDLRDDLIVDIGELQAKTELARIEVTIPGRLQDALHKAGQRRALAPLLEEVFIGGLDRKPGQTPARLIVLVERQSIEGDIIAYGRIFGAEVRIDKTTRQAFHFVTNDDTSGYYNELGAPQRSSLLRNPVPEAVLTSGFGLRRHPIRRRRRMHKGLDYGAPKGTPVHAAAAGTVVRARRRGHLGKLVTLRHKDGLVTRYAHLSRFNARAGDEVRQGQVVGYIGSTGLSSGSHLHFETIVNERHINPQILLAAPAPTLSDADLEAYLEHVQDLLHRLNPAASAPQDA